MSVDRYDYIIFGAKVHRDLIEWEEFQEEFEGAPNSRFDIVDRYDGETLIVGKILYSTTDKWVGFGITPLNLSELPDESLRTTIIQATGIENIPPLELLAVTVFS